MKILAVTEFYSERGGGVRSHLTLKGQALCQLGHEQVVVAPGPQDGETLLAFSSCKPAGKLVRVRGRALPYDPTYHLLWRVDKVHDVIARERPDVLEIHSPYVAAASAVTARERWFSVRTFQWHSDFIDTYLRTTLERRVGPASADVLLAPLWAMVRGIGARCDATLVAAKWQVDKLREHGVPRVVHVPFGVERADFSPDARSEARRRELLGPGREQATLLVGVGRFAVEKRWDVAIDAFARIRRSRDAVLVLFGDGPERARMIEQARRLGVEHDVRMPGFTTDRRALASAFASADAMLHACPFETFGLSIAEALCCGLPVVVPDAGGAGELADPSCSEVFSGNDASACAAAMERLLARDRGSLRAAAIAASRNVPTVLEQLTRTLDLYKELLERRGGEG